MIFDDDGEDEVKDEEDEDDDPKSSEYEDSDEEPESSVYEDSDEEAENGEDDAVIVGAARWKNNIANKAKESFIQRQMNAKNLHTV